MRVFVIRGMSNSYLTDDGVLVDAGARPRDVLRVAEANGVRIRYLFVTHYHVDHVRYAADMVRAAGCRVAASAVEADYIEGLRRREYPSLLGRLADAVLRPRPVRVDVRLGDGDELEGYRVVMAPGHTPGSAALFKDGALFSGDAVLGSGGRPSMPPRRFTLDWSEAERSFRRLLDLRPSVIYPGHGEPIRLP